MRHAMRRPVTCLPARKARRTAPLTALAMLLTIAAPAAEAQSPQDPPRSEAASNPAPGSAAKTAMPSFSDLVRDLGSDFLHVPSRQNALILGAAGAFSLAVAPTDSTVTRTLLYSQAADLTFEPGDGLGNGAVQVGGAVATYLVGRLAGSSSVAGLGAELIRAQAVNAVLTTGIKVSVNRTRPNGGPHSFPSGHTSSAFATATVLQQHFGWKAGVPAYGLAAFVAGSRLQENRHYLSDVIFGAAVGIVSGRAVTVRMGRARFAVAPMAAPGGTGVMFTLVDDR
jgi:membrane-associated phospholipid phosphatase